MNLETLLKQRLRPVRARVYMTRILRGALLGLLAASLITCGLGLARYLGVRIEWLAAGLVPPIGVVLGGAIAAFRVPSWIEVAVRIDRCYRLKDRTLTALEFCRLASESPLHKLQVDDALDRLARVVPDRVVPRILPETLPYACVSFVVALVLLCLPPGVRSVTARPRQAPAHLVHLAEDLQRKMLDPLREIRESSSDVLEQRDREQMDRFLNDLDKKIQELKVPGSETREALANLSEIQAKLAETMASFDQKLVDAQMEALGNIMQISDATKKLASALKGADYQVAADELESLQPASISKQNKSQMAEATRKLADKMGDAGLKKLAQSTRELGQTLDDQSETPDSHARQQAAASKLGKMARQLAARQAIMARLASQKVRLDESKGMARSGGEHSDRSSTPRQTWGRGAAPESFIGDETQLDTRRDRKTITGVAGDGPSEREVVRSTEAGPPEDLDYEQRYLQFRRAAESVLEQEALPLGHRQTIRRYFEEIRPSE